MIDCTFRILIAVLGCAVLGGCASGAKLLPDDGPTTAELWAGDTRGATDKARAKNSAKDQAPHPHQSFRAQSDTRDHSSAASRSLGGRGSLRLLESPGSMSAQSTSAMEALNQDFREIPNPQIIAYVYPHFNTAELPVPGYFTKFRLYSRNHYAPIEARAEEGLNR